MTRVYLITGFLGTGKTTAILHLLKHKPAAEKWAVLVNEFGEVGIDGAILKTTGVAVKEVPGGCMCCVSGLPFQFGLNMLISREQPDVLLIEPTGLGHPRNILQTLTHPDYQELLSLGPSLCLLDPRHLLSTKHLEHEVFNDQIQLADVLIANKTDLCGAPEREAFDALITNAMPAKAANAWVTQGQIPIELLNCERNPERLVVTPKSHQQSSEPLKISLPLGPNEPHRRLENQGQGYFSVGWLLKPELVFELNALRSWMTGLEVERLKAVINTDQGGLILNLREGILSESPCPAPEESRLEIITNQSLSGLDLEQQLLGCLVATL